MVQHTTIIWFFVGIFLLVIEIMTPTFFICCFGVGCLAAALSGFLFGSLLLVQLLAFLIATTVTFVLIRPLANRVHSGESKVKHGLESMIGKSARVLEQIGPGTLPGRVKVGSENWKAISKDGTLHFVGEDVVIESIEGVTVSVKSINQSNGRI